MDIQQRRALATFVGKLDSPVFLAAWEKQGSVLTLHVSDVSAARALKTQAPQAAADAGLDMKIQVRAHALQKLTHPRSLEHWLKRFASGEIVYDPTQIASRAHGLVEAVKACRKAIGKAIVATFFDAHNRCLVVLTRLASEPSGASIARRTIVDVATSAWRQVAASFSIGSALARTEEPALNVRVVSTIPHGHYVPVDARSVSLLAHTSRRMRTWFAAAAVALSMAVAPAALAKPQPDSPSRVQTEWGMLPALSVFAEGSAPEAEPFVIEGLRLYLAQIGFECRDTRGRPAPCPPIYLGS